MGSWLVHYLAGGLRTPGRALPVAAFRILIALGTLWKLGYEWHRRAWSWFAPGSYSRHQYRSRPHRVTPIETWYRALLVAKTIAALLLFAGVFARPAAGVLLVAFAFEYSYNAQYHTMLYALSAAVLAISPGTGACLTPATVVDAVHHGLAATLTEESSRRCDAFAQVLMVIVVCGMYFGSAYRKALTPRFMSGSVLHRWFEHLSLIRHQLPYREDWLPAGLLRRLADAPERFWRPAAVATVAVEAVLPVGLLYPPAWPYALIVGAGMHAVFAVIYPVRVVPFSLASVGAYLMFLAPS